MADTDGTGNRRRYRTALFVAVALMLCAGTGTIVVDLTGHSSPLSVAIFLGLTIVAAGVLVVTAVLLRRR